MNDKIRGLPNGDFEVQSAQVCRLCGKRRGEHRHHDKACVSTDPEHNHWHPSNRFASTDGAVEESIFDWHTWTGGEMPVPKGVLVDVQYRNGTGRAAVAGDPSQGARFWHHDGGGEDIMRYRLRNPPAPTIGESDDPTRPGPTCARHWPTFHMDCQICKDTCNRRIELNILNPQPTPRAHSHYFKDVSKLQTIDVYRVLSLFNVSDPCLQHAVKKLLVAGGRGGGKDISRDIQEAIDTLQRWQGMRAEEAVS